jgi:hypothetical protein
VVLPRVVAAAVLDAEAALRQAEAAASGAEAEPQLAAGVVELRLVVRAGSVVSPPAAGPSAAPWVFRRGRLLPWPARRPAVRSRHGTRMSRAASLSERSWQAARGEGLS